LFVAANNLAGRARTRFAVVRYGNVVGSRGSVVPHFQSLIERGTDHLPVTHERMTRFWISLQQGVDMVIRCFHRMYGGEIFVPKIPSIRIVDLASAMAPDLPVRFTGIRPGEKLHEVMCPQEDSHLTLKFEDHFVIRPAIRFTSSPNGNCFECNAMGERGRPVPDEFEYRSGSNPWFLDRDQIIEFNRRALQ
jgi:UDP-N-acetylglucosamine 4,6-dehydratase